MLPACIGWKEYQPPRSRVRDSRRRGLYPRLALVGGESQPQQNLFISIQPNRKTAKLLILLHLSVSSHSCSVILLDVHFVSSYIPNRKAAKLLIYIQMSILPEFLAKKGLN